MPTMREVAPSEWIKATDFRQGEERTYTIAGWERSDFKDQSGKVKKSWSLRFAETESKLGIVNRANEDSLNKIFGAGFDLDAITGTRITLFTIMVKQNDDGSPIMGVRIKPANGNGNNGGGHASNQIDGLRAALKDARDALRKADLPVEALTQKQVNAMTAEQLQEKLNEALAALPV